MTKYLKISLVGLEGSGKTTTLKALNPNAYIQDSLKREITEIEAKAWKKSIGTKIPTTTVPNFTHIKFNNKNQITGSYSSFNMNKDENICTIIDTCGQEYFFNLTRDAIDESNGILFVIDSTIPIISQIPRLIELYANIISNFNEYIPINILLNKQDDLSEIKALKNESSEYIGKIEKLRPILRAYLPELKEARFFNGSALLNYNINECIESLLSKVMNRIMENNPMIM